MLDHLLRLRLVDGVEHVEEVAAVWQLALRQVVWHVRHELRVLAVPRVEVADGDLVVLGRVDLLDVLEGEQLLLVAQDLLEEVLVDHGVGRYIELKALRDYKDKSGVDGGTYNSEQSHTCSRSGVPSPEA